MITRTLIILSMLAMPLTAQFGGVLKNRMSTNPSNTRISAEGKLDDGSTGTRQVKAGETSKSQGVKDCDMAVMVVRYGEGAKDYKFMTRRIHNLQTHTIKDGDNTGSSNGWREVDGNSMSDTDFQKALDKYWHFEEGGIHILGRHGATAVSVRAKLAA